MSYIGQAPGLGQRTAFRFVAYMGQTKFTGLDATGYPLGYTPGLVDVFVNGRLLSEPDYTASDGSTLTINTALDLGTEVRVLAQAPFSPANTYTMAQADAAFNRRRNRVTDPGMRVSQENGSNLLTPASAATVYPSDGFAFVRAGSTGGMTVQRIAMATPGGSPYRIRATVTGANAAPAAGDYVQFQARIEGIDVADLRFGTLAPRTIAVRFGCRATVAGIYSVAVLNGPFNRTWLGTVQITQADVGQDVVRTVTLVGDQTGTWATDNTLGMLVSVVLCAGSNYQGVPGWQPGLLLASAGSTNLMATNGATFDLFDVGLYDVTGLQSGVIPPFELDSFDRDLAKCQRYFYNYTAPGAWYAPLAANGSLLRQLNFFFPVIMRATPSITTTNITSNGFGSGSPYLEAVSTLNARLRGDVPNGDAWAQLTSLVANARL